MQGRKIALASRRLLTQPLETDRFAILGGRSAAKLDSDTDANCWRLAGNSHAAVSATSIDSAGPRQNVLTRPCGVRADDR
jgi:hypothetical protein